jgi:arginyl-tRNA synthetase
VFHHLEKIVQKAFSSHILIRYGVGISVTIEQPKQSDFGELALPVAFQLAKALKKAPKAIATELKAEIGPIEGVAAMEVAGNGYLNIRFDRGAYARSLMAAVSNQFAA